MKTSRTFACSSCLLAGAPWPHRMISAASRQPRQRYLVMAAQHLRYITHTSPARGDRIARQHRDHNMQKPPLLSSHWFCSYAEVSPSSQLTTDLTDVGFNKIVISDWNVKLKYDNPSLGIIHNQFVIYPVVCLYHLPTTPDSSWRSELISGWILLLLMVNDIITGYLRLITDIFNNLLSFNFISVQKRKFCNSDNIL